MKETNLHQLLYEIPLLLGLPCGVTELIARSVWRVQTLFQVVGSTDIHRALARDDDIPTCGRRKNGATDGKVVWWYKCQGPAIALNPGKASRCSQQPPDQVCVIEIDERYEEFSHRVLLSGLPTPIAISI